MESHTALRQKEGLNQIWNVWEDISNMKCLRYLGGCNHHNRVNSEIRKVRGLKTGDPDDSILEKWSYFSVGEERFCWLVFLFLALRKILMKIWKVTVKNSPVKSLKRFLSVTIAKFPRWSWDHEFLILQSTRQAHGPYLFATWTAGTMPLDIFPLGFVTCKAQVMALPPSRLSWDLSEIRSVMWLAHTQQVNNYP